MLLATIPSLDDDDDETEEDATGKPGNKQPVEVIDAETEKGRDELRRFIQMKG